MRSIKDILLAGNSLASNDRLNSFFFLRVQIRSRKHVNDLLLFSYKVMSNSLWLHGLQHTRLSCPSLSPGVFSSLMARMVKRLPAVQEIWVQSLGPEDPLEKEMATHSSTLAWKIPWTEEPGTLQSMGLQRVGHNWVTSLSVWRGFFELKCH